MLSRQAQCRRLPGVCREIRRALCVDANRSPEHARKLKIIKNTFRSGAPERRAVRQRLGSRRAVRSASRCRTSVTATHGTQHAKADMPRHARLRPSPPGCCRHAGSGVSAACQNWAEWTRDVPTGVAHVQPNEYMLRSLIAIRRVRRRAARRAATLYSASNICRHSWKRGAHQQRHGVRTKSCMEMSYMLAHATLTASSTYAAGGRRRATRMSSSGACFVPPRSTCTPTTSVGSV